MNSAPAIATEACWICGSLQFSDSFYPTGSYAHSFGLEGLVQAEVVRDRETLRTFVFCSVVPALRNLELPLAAQAHRALEQRDWSLVGELCQLSSVLKTPVEARRAAEAIGRQRADLVAALRPSDLTSEFMRRAAAEKWPFSPAVSAALEGNVAGAPVVAVLASIYYSSVASLLAAAMKLLRIGQNGCQTLLTEAMGQAALAIEAALALPIEEIGWFNPWLDIAAARHETAEARLFIS
jgi:urease accessory protein